METLDTFLQRNKKFATQHAAAGLIQPSLAETLLTVKALIIGCADMRVDPALLLGLKDGEAVVLRDIGGRVVPTILEQLGLLGRVGEVAGAIPGGGEPFHLIVLHHTDCGMKRLAGDPDLLASYFGISKEELEARAVTDPRASVAVDVALLKATPGLPGDWLLSGLVYEVSTGLVETIVPPAPIRAQQ